MNRELVLKLETLVKRLLERNRQLEKERASLLDEREQLRCELDGILAKLDQLDRELP